MKKADFLHFPKWSAEYVLAHAAWQRSRGRKPSTPYRGERNPLKAELKALLMSADKEFYDVKIVEVEEHFFTGDDGFSFSIQSEWNVPINVGDVARFYCKGPFYTIRGIDINGVPCFYRTKEEEAKRREEEIKRHEEEQMAKFEENRAALDKSYAKLPKAFQKRLDKFRTNNPNFRWKFEDYEMFCCEQAVIMARGIRKMIVQRAIKEGTDPKDAKKISDELFVQEFQKFGKLDPEKQRKKVSGIADDHSGNTFGISLRLGLFYLIDQEKVVRMHGALAPLVGSEEYGCVPREPVYAEAAPETYVPILVTPRPAFN